MNTVPNIVDVNAGNFQSEVVEQSSKMPVLLEFYAESAEPSRQLAPVLRQLATEYQGKFQLARIDIQTNPQLVQQLGVRTLPTIKVIFQGKMVKDLEGPQEAGTLRSLLDNLTMSPMERVREQINQLLINGQRSQAIKMLQGVIADEPENNGLKVELCDLLILEGRVRDATKILSALPDDTQGIEKPKNRLVFIDLAAELPTALELRSMVEANADNLQLRLHLAYRLIVEDEIEAALDQLLFILKLDRDWQGQKARITMIDVFSLLGKGNELATKYRRLMFAFLH